ncbi:STAS/SEC14 domain-containing protein [Bacillus sp. V5-8f]|uniref:STAS/SEC14 domain-containing protein n=1 Tax=Bacillus sp. V5-8f TaxID=2053044 RepID=UPI000C788D1E|nr:STAS/SEC14 domain-containing protein [Bacillus sp. V5-8f]PLT32087.1 hypothetical protein CUU64_21205 [Bacillus sp. V5-8f]
MQKGRTVQCYYFAESRHITIAIEFDGKATKEDAMILDNYVRSNFQENEKFNILAIMHGLDGMTVRGIVDGVKFDAKRWMQFNKFAVISDTFI